ncbi:hypothetical protein D9M68_508990 [compost metagenome]
MLTCNPLQPLQGIERQHQGPLLILIEECDFPDQRPRSILEPRHKAQIPALHSVYRHQQLTFETLECLLRTITENRVPDIAAVSLRIGAR